MVASRVDPPFPVSRLRARDQLVEIRADDLSFTPEEASALLADTVGIEVDAADVAHLVERTEGWATGLYLAGLSLRSRDDRASFLAEMSVVERHLVDYLTEEVLDAQPVHLRRFLLHTSVLDELTGPACDAVLDTSGSVVVLRELEDLSLFVVPLDGERTAWRYHQLLADVLRSHLADDPDLAAELHRGGGLPRGARCGVAGDPPRRRRRRHRRRPRADPRVVVAVHQRRSSGDGVELGRRAPRRRGATVRRAVRDVRLGPPQPRRLRRHRALVLEAERERGGGPFVDAATIRSHRERHIGRTSASLRWGVEAVERAGDLATSSAVAGRTAHAVAAYWAGEPEAAELLRRAEKEAAGLDEPSSVVMAGAYLAVVAADEGDHDEALRAAGQALARCEAEEQERHHLPAMAHLALAVVAVDDWRLREAGIHLADALRLATIAREPHQRVRIDLVAARLAHRMGDVDEARARLRAALRRVGTLHGAGLVGELVRAASNELRFAPRPTEDALPPGARDLTSRELEVLRLLPSGLNRAEMAEELCVSVNTVKTHLTAIGRKLSASGRGEIVERARDLDLLG